MIKFSLIDAKKQRIKFERQQVYNKIFSAICDTINLNLSENKKFCLYQVPGFIFGEISYPLYDCLDYLNHKIKKSICDKSNIIAEFYSPNVYFFKW
jgi:hypothetical protein